MYIVGLGYMYRSFSFLFATLFLLLSSILVIVSSSSVVEVAPAASYEYSNIIFLNTHSDLYELVVVVVTAFSFICYRFFFYYYFTERLLLSDGGYLNLPLLKTKKHNKQTNRRGAGMGDVTPRMDGWMDGWMDGCLHAYMGHGLPRRIPL